MDLKREKDTKKDNYDMKVCSVSHWGLGMNMMKIKSYHIQKNLKKIKAIKVERCVQCAALL